MPIQHLSKAFIPALILTAPSAGLAQPPDVIREYLKPIISKIAADPNAGGWTWKTNGHGGYLLRRFVDVTGDGTPELFLSSTLLTTKWDSVWTVFQISPDGKYAHYSDLLHPSLGWEVSQETPPKLLYIGGQDHEKYKNNDPKSYPLHKFEFNFPKIKEHITHIDETEVLNLFKGVSGLFPNVESILLADYLADPNQEWHVEKEWIMDASDCLFQPGNQERAQKNTSFTPEVALARLGVAQMPTSSEGQTSEFEKKPDSVSTAAQVSSLDKTASAGAGTGTGTGKAASSAKWIALPAAVIALAALSLLWEKLRGGNPS